MGSRSSSRKNKNVLDAFGINLNEQARSDGMDPVIGREQEIDRVIQILSRRGKNNPVLIGEPGVGKTAIAEGLAIKIVQGDIHPALADYTIWALDMGSLVAGTQFRGQFEERMKAIVEEFRKRDGVVVFIDEIHTVMGAGSARGSLDAANILKPALARGKIQCIGATTLDEFRQSIEKDGALDRRFQKVLIYPPTVDETIEIVSNVKKYYEDHHSVTYSNSVVEDVVRLSDRYISDRYFPDKALDVLDEAGSRVHLQNVDPPEKLERLQEKRDCIEKAKKKAVSVQDFAKAADLRDKQSNIEDKIQVIENEWNVKFEENAFRVSREDVSEVVSMITGVPTSTISNDEREKLLTLEEKLKERVVGQDTACTKVAKAVRRSASGIRDPRRPIGTFIFLGQTGVGKTELSKQLTRTLLGSTENLIRFDMSEFMNRFSVSRLIGSPPGYVGYDKGGELTEKVRRNPYSVILFDEIEKAHPDIYNSLLQIMDDGRLTDGAGREVDFTNTIIIMTSNVGAKKLSKNATNSTFGFNTETAGQKMNQKVAEQISKESLEQEFSPEFLNRLDGVVVFNSLSKNDLFEIVDIEMACVRNRLEEQNITLEITRPAKDLISNEGYDPEYGARPLSRAIRRLVEEPLSELILANKVSGGDTVKARKRGNKIEFDRVE